MSSFFDKMGTILYDNSGREFIAYVFKLYGFYMSKLADEMNDENLEKFSPYQMKFWKLEHRVQNGEIAPDKALVLLHDFAHDLGSSGLKTKDGSWASDNPWVVY